MNLKLKHKKLIVIVSMCVLGVGMLTFSFTNKSDKSNKSGQAEATNNTLGDSEDDVEPQAAGIGSSGGKETEPTATPTPEPEPALVFEVNAYEDINNLITQYLEAELDPSVESFTPLVNDPSLLDVEGIKRKTTFVESVQNISCHSIDAPKENTRLVYVYYDIKFTGIETLVPAINKFLVVTEEGKEPYVYFGDLDEEMETFINEVHESDTYGELVNQVNEKLEQALEQDSVLNEFVTKLQQQTQAEEQSQEEQEQSQDETQEQTQSEEQTQEQTQTEEQTENEGSSEE
jgi:hypothetical protein